MTPQTKTFAAAMTQNPWAVWARWWVAVCGR